MDLKLVTTAPWAPHPRTAPVTSRDAEARYVVAANGTRTCAGGWQFGFTGAEPGKTYTVAVVADTRDVDCIRDRLLCTVHWAALTPTEYRHGTQPWDYLLPRPDGEGRTRFERTVCAPADATALTVRCSYRWSATGKVAWQTPTVVPSAAATAPTAPVRVAVVTGHANARPRPVTGVQTNLEFYGRLCEEACRRTQPNLVVLPEIALQWGVSGHAVDLAVPVPGPETDVFARLARQYHTHIVVGLYERAGDATHNTAALIGPDGTVAGRYRKVHLAVGGEAESGLLPGDSFPVFGTAVGRIGCNICMDSSATESSRMVGLNGADFLVLPIMGDHRADRWTPGNPIYHESRWLAIMRTRAMDNQLCMVVARNSAVGSAIIDRKGDLLAWNEGDADFIVADVPHHDGYRSWNGACFLDINWMQRRPHLYGAFTDPANTGSLR